MTRNLAAWAIPAATQLTPMEMAMEALLQLTRTLALEPSEEARAEVERRLLYGVEKLITRLAEGVQDDERERVTAIRLLRNAGLQAYLDGHHLLLEAEDLLAAADRAQAFFEEGDALLKMAEAQVEELMEMCPYQG